MTEFYEKILPQIADNLSKNQLKRLEEFYHLLQKDYQKHLFLFCLNYTIIKNQSLIRKTGAPNVVHPLHIALTAMTYDMDYTIVCAAFLHDIIEDQIEEHVKTKTFFLRDHKVQLRINLRQEYFQKLTNDLTHIPQKTNDQQAKEDAHMILALVDLLTRYKTTNQHYYDYIKSNFSIHNTEYSKKIIYYAILLKCLDRTDNIMTMDTELRKVINDKLKAELKILEQIESDKIKKKYRKVLSEQNSLLIDYSFSGGNRLNQIWKNTYLLIRARMYFCQNPEFYNQPLTKKIEHNLIKQTLKVLVNHKNNLRIYLSDEITSRWDKLAKKYNELGGLEGRTPESVQKPPKEKEYLIFNSTLDIFSQYLLKNNKEFKKLQIDKETQYKYLALIYEMLIKFEKDPTFVCDLSKQVTLKEDK